MGHTAVKTSAVNLIGSLHHMSLAVLFFLLLSKALLMNQNHETISRQRETSCRPTVAAFKGEKKKKKNALECCEGGGVGAWGCFLSRKEASRVGSHV